MVDVGMGKVLIVEDDGGVATLQRKRLERAGFEAVSVATAEEALRVIRQGGVELIVLDYRLPGDMTGLDFYSQLKNAGYDLPVIMVTGFSEEATVVKALRAGVRDFVSKSVEYLEYLPEAAKRVLSQVRMERRLVESEARLASIIGSAKDAIIILEDQHITLFNAAAEQMFGCVADQALGQRISKFIPHEFHEPATAAAADEGPVSLIVRTGRRGIRADGTEFPLETSVSRVEVLGRRFHTLMVRDITERERADRRMKQQAALLDEANDAILVRDMEGRIVYWNSGAQRIYGWSKEEALGQRAETFLYREPMRDLDTLMQTCLEKGKWTGELQHLSKARNALDVASSWTLVRDANGEPRAVLVINTDVTEKKKLETQYLRSQRMESLGTLAGGIAHDLNNVLTPILLGVELLQCDADTSGREMLTTLRASVERGADLVRQILAFARGTEEKRQAVLLPPLLGEICKLLQQTFPKAIEIEARIPKDLWLISAEATHIHQVFMNLCVNARDAMPNGGRLLFSGKNLTLTPYDAEVNPDIKPGPYVLLTVEDNGSGIPPNVLDKIFDPFFTTKEVGKGTGLGLSTSVGIVKSHGGFINVYSEVGKGTKFKIYLPALETGEVKPAREKPPLLPSGHGQWILVVDDEESILQLCKVILEANGYRVITASKGVDALNFYKERYRDIQIVLTDMAMPHMDGPSVIRDLHEVNPHVRIIASSGFLPDPSRSASETSLPGARKFLVKPFTALSLLNAVREVLTQE